ncbi:MAG: LUD domain-containing protein [Ignavibacteriaceae bacterium]
MENINDYSIHPRQVADKSSKDSLRKSIKLALDVETDALRLNTQTFNTNRYEAVKKLDDYEDLKDRARAIKEKSIENMLQLISLLTKTIEARGGKVFYAKTKEDATKYIKDVCLSHKANLVVKSKSITTEEIELNSVLEKADIEVAETDLAEFILQVSKEQPSHNIAPAIHRSRESISELFKRNFRTDKSLETGEELTEFARDILRQKFLSADVGISGANLIAAEEGTLLLVESEGNIRLTTQLPAVHIAIAGIEKIIQSKKDFWVFIELLAASGTGQSLTSYTNILEPPLDLPILNLNGREDKKREFHLVLVDNGRMLMREDEELKEALYCIRCSACMNSCANFQTVGGHAFGGECYVGGIGGAWTVGTTGNVEKGRFAELCTGCSRCVPNCPVRIDIPRLNTTIKNRLIKIDGGPSLQKLFFGNFTKLGQYASLAPTLSNWIGGLPISRTLMEKIVGFDKRRSIPRFANKTLIREYKHYRKNNITKNNTKQLLSEVVLFADVYTNYNNPQIGMAAIRVFDKLRIPITLSKVLSEGRASQSQGLVELAQREALKLATYLESLIDQGKEIIVVEPSVLSLFRYDYKKLIQDDRLFNKLAGHTYDPIEYLNDLMINEKLDLKDNIEIPKSISTNIFYHAHCQMKTIGAGNAAVEFFRSIGFKVDISNVECCGMAGSFGYKKEYYDVSKNIGNELIKQIKNSTSYDGKKVILASGTSCREQISSELENIIYHPIEYLEKIL